MWLTCWLRNRNRSRAGTRGGRPSVPHKPLTFRPRLEALEDRWLPSTLTVTTAADSSTSPIAGSLANAISLAQNGDTIVFDTSLKGQTITLSGRELLINKNLTIQGLGAANLAISGGNQSRIFEVASGATVTLSGMTIENGNGFASNSGTVLWGGSFEDGGAILNQGTLTLSGDTLSGNSSYNDGGAIANEVGATLTVTGSTVSSNHASQDGGGIYNGGTTTLSGSTVTRNSASFGGGIYNSYTLTVLSSTVTGNTPDDLYNVGIYKHQQSKVGKVDG